MKMNVHLMQIAYISLGSLHALRDQVIGESHVRYQPSPRAPKVMHSYLRLILNAPAMLPDER